MKTISGIIFFIMLSSNLFSQNIKYSISAGSNYSFFSNFKNNNFIDPESTSYGNTYLSSESIRSDGGFGFFIDNNFCFPINNRLAFKTGFGLRMNNIDLIRSSRTTSMTYFSGTSTLTGYNDRQPFIVPNSVVEVLDSSGNVIGYEENTRPILLDSLSSYYQSNYYPSYQYKSDYNIFTISLPIGMQLSFLKNKMNISTGILISRIINVRKTNYISSGESYKYNADNEFEKLFFSLKLGAEYKIFKNFFAGVSYDLSISELKNNSSYTLYNNKLHISNLSLGLSYKL